MKSRRTPEQQRWILDLRRSSAASKHRNKKKYTRKAKRRPIKDLRNADYDD